MTFEFAGDPAAQFAQLARRLREAGRNDLRLELTRGTRKLLKPMVEAAKAAALAIPSRGTGSTGLRQLFADAIRSEIRTGRQRGGVWVKVKRGQLGDKAGLPAGFERGQFRHPVMGDMDIWVTQFTFSEGWFSDVAKKFGPMARRTIMQAMKDVADRIRG